MPSLMKARSGVLNSNIGGNALAPLFSTGSLTTADLITDVTRLAGVEGDGAAYPDSSAGVWPAATNLLYASGDFSSAHWTVPPGMDKTSTTASDPGGGSTALLATLTSGSHALYQARTVTPGSAYTFSWFAKKGTATDVKYSVYDETNAANVVAATSYGSLLNTSTFVRISVTVTAPAGCVSLRVYPLRDSGVTGTVTVAWPQVELGAIATPYIKTAAGAAASRSLGRWYSATNARLNGNRGWIAVRFKCGGLVSYAPLVTLQNDTDSGSDNRVTIDSSSGVGRYRMERKDTSTTVQASLAAGDAFVAGDAGLIVARWSPTAVGFAKGGGLGWNNTAATNTFSYNSHRLDTRQRWSPSTGSYSTQYWVAAGDGDMPDAGLDLMYGWGNNDPLPHMFPSSWGLCELSHFNGDGTFYRRSA